MPASASELETGLLRPGQVIDGRYRIESYLGGGGMASVYRAIHLVLEQPVAIKILSPAIRAVPGAAARFIREARAATQLKSVNVVRVSDVGTLADGAPYMVMELLEGQDLDEKLASGWLPSVEEAVHFVLQTCTALAEVHNLGIVHRDLKPANLFLTTGSDGRPLIKLIDFGISRVESPVVGADAVGLTNPDEVMGSPRYMSPEAMESATNADTRSDIWALGTILHELLVGHAPYDGNALVDFYAAALNGPPVAASSLREEVPKGIDEVIARCLNIDPKERFADVAELAVARAPFGGESAVKEAEEIIRVLDATRRRVSSPDAMPDSERVESELSRVRRHVSRITGAAKRRRKRIALSVVTVAIAASLGAFGSRRPEVVSGAWTNVSSRIGLSAASSVETPSSDVPAPITTTLSASALEVRPEPAPEAGAADVVLTAPPASAPVATAKVAPARRATPARAPSRANVSSAELFDEPSPSPAAPAVASTEAPPPTPAPTPASTATLFEDRQ